MIEIDIEKLIPHRSGMLLIDEVISVDGERAKTSSTVKKSWPLILNNHVDSMIIIELAAQTAGICRGWKERQKDENGDGKGWLVGIKKADFFRGKIPVGSKITVYTENSGALDNYIEISGRAETDEFKVGEVLLQVFRS